MNQETGSRSFLDAMALSRLAAVPLVSRGPMLGTVSGRHPSPHRGSSVEFAEYRKYVPGDDPRRVDWRAFGRSERYYVKEFEADTNLRCCLVIDTSGSMGFESTGITKYAYARQVAGSLAYLAVQQGDAVGLTCVADGIVTNIPTRRNPAHLTTLFDALENTKPAGPTQLIPVLHELAESLRQRAMIVVLSDFFVEADELRSCLEHLRFRKHDISIFHLLDSQECDFRFQRPTRFVDMEGGPYVFADPQEIADRYQRAMQDHLAAVQNIMRETAVDYHRVRTDESYERFLMQFLIARHQGRGQR